MNAPTTTDAAALLNKVGAVVQVAVDEVDRGKVDDSNATLVVVELVVVTGSKRKETKYRLAGPTGTVNTLYSRSYVKPLKKATERRWWAWTALFRTVAGSPSGKFISK